ncbi:AAA family ATPase [uncultured Salegentibacter sp.]|uniref:nuclease-related domain-containing DEAD/DEAH box helicase n=1 Tax=uncultured Salegentibacter sp. TaxID=259320 RepID=UPI002598364A|nr:AAA family ATPase [uncultured Salegentibacter sp.]
MIYPEEFPAYHSDRAEQKVFEALFKLDPYQFDVFWNRTFAGKTKEETDLYEIDFLIFDLREERLDHIFVIEVKGGNLRFEAEENKWFQSGREMETAPDHQVMGYVSNILKRYAQQIEYKVPVTWLLWFPDGVLEDEFALPTQFHQWRILDQADLDNPLQALEEVREAQESSYNHYKGITPDEYEATIKKDLTQGLSISFNLRALLEDMDISIERVEKGQQAFFNGFLQLPRLAVEGGAGSGKTVLARCAAEILTKQGKKVLFLCFNTYLCTQLRQELHPDIKTDNIHNFMRRLVDERAPGWFEQQEKEKTFWEKGLPDKFKELMKQEPLKGDEQFDVLLIDEAQDMEVGWLNAVKKYLKRDGQFFLFFDKRQNIFDRNFVLPQGESWTPLPLNFNYRNTRKINAFINDTLGTSAVSHQVPEGEEVKLREYSEEDLGGALSRCLLELHQVGKVPLNQIVVITDGSTAKWDLSQWNNGFCYEALDPEKESTGKSVSFSSIHRFKGCEAPVVILVLKRRLEEIKNGKQYQKNRLYTQLSRAKSLLYVLEPEMERNET